MAKKKKPKRILEKDVELPVCEYARTKGVKAYKLNGDGDRSKPDRMFMCPPRRVLFVEFKRPGNVPTQGQIAEMRLLVKAGQAVTWADTVDKGKQIIDDLINGKYHQTKPDPIQAEVLPEVDY